MRDRESAAEIWLHCHKCNSKRKGPDICWKCQGPLEVPAEGWEYPRQPPIDRIRALAKEVGYALAVHGSLERDVDLIASPWTTEAASYYKLMRHIADGVNGRIIEIEKKPLGRWACTICMEGWYQPIDLSVCPRVNEEHTEQWRGIFKLFEEMGETIQVLAKLGVFPDGVHPDGAGCLVERLHDEMADMDAASSYFKATNNMDFDKMDIRTVDKLLKFEKWGLTGVSPSPVKVKNYNDESTDEDN